MRLKVHHQWHSKPEIKWKANAENGSLMYKTPKTEAEKDGKEKLYAKKKKLSLSIGTA